MKMRLFQLANWIMFPCKHGVIWCRGGLISFSHDTRQDIGVDLSIDPGLYETFPGGLPMLYPEVPGFS